MLPQILEQGGDSKEREYAKSIIPVRERGNLLLCTLLLGNTVSYAAGQYMSCCMLGVHSF